MPVGYVNRAMERLSITFRSDGKREFVPRDQVSPLLVVYCSLFQPGVQHKLVVSRNFLSIRIVLSCFYLLIFYFEKFLTWIYCLPFAVYAMLKTLLKFSNVPGCSIFPGLELSFAGEPTRGVLARATWLTWQHTLLCFVKD